MRNNYKSKITKLLVLTALSSTFFPTYNISALTYQSDIGINFTFNPILSISVGPSNLVIPDLTPGTTNDSNAINISVATNSAYGYILTASAGNSTIYNSTNLIHNNSNNIFSSIPTDASLSSLEDSSDNNIWGYSYKLSSSNTWSNYSGLPLYNGPLKVLLNTDSNDETNNTIDFKIAAKASSTQASGEYNNVVNFSAVTKPMPTTLAEAYANYYSATNRTMHNGYYVMQDMADSHICENTEAIGSELQVIDIRDDKVYWIAKLADGKCWMTQNLDLAGGTTLTSDTTDFDPSYTIPDSQGWQPGGKLPESSTSGFTNNNYAYVYNSGNTTTDCSNPGCYSYYSWDTATLGSGRDIATENTDAPYSICPRGWRLPTTGRPSNNEWKRGDFYSLAISYGANLENSYYDSSAATGKNFCNNAGPNTIPNFLFAGYYENSSFNYGNSNGYYWSSTSRGFNPYARSLNFSSSRIDSANSFQRNIGFSIRCIAK